MCKKCVAIERGLYSLVQQARTFDYFWIIWSQFSQTEFLNLKLIFFEEEEKQNPSKYCETNRSLSSVFSCFQRELLFYTTKKVYKKDKRDISEQAFDNILSKRILSRL